MSDKLSLDILIDNLDDVAQVLVKENSYLVGQFFLRRGPVMQFSLDLNSLGGLGWS